MQRRYRHVATGLMVAALLGPAMAIAGADTDADRSHPKSYVKDSVITAKIKSKLAMEHAGSLAHIHVDTDNRGVVYLSGTARSQEAIDRAVAIARGTERVKAVRNHISIKQDD